MSESTECYADLMATGVCFMKDGKRIDPAEVQLKYTEAELQEKLRQQREGFKHNLSVIENELKQIDEAECSLAVWDRVCIALEFAEK